MSYQQFLIDGRVVDDGKIITNFLKNIILDSHCVSFSELNNNKLNTISLSFKLSTSETSNISRLQENILNNVNKLANIPKIIQNIPRNGQEFLNVLFFAPLLNISSTDPLDIKILKYQGSATY